jgi:hypothetical protein
MSLWGKIFGTDEAIKETIGAVKSGLDALVYTDEEKAVDAAKDRSEARGMLVQWMEATQGQNLARRVISLAITGVWLLQYILSFLASSLAIFWIDKADKLNALAKIQTQGATDMSSAVMLILAFYFAAPHLGDFAKAFIDRTKVVNEQNQSK